MRYQRVIYLICSNTHNMGKLKTCFHYIISNKIYLIFSWRPWFSSFENQNGSRSRLCSFCIPFDCSISSHRHTLTTTANLKCLPVCVCMPNTIVILRYILVSPSFSDLSQCYPFIYPEKNLTSSNYTHTPSLHICCVKC